MSQGPQGEAESPRGFGAACQALGLSPPFRGKILSHPVSPVLLPAPAVLPASPHTAQGVPCPLSSLPGERPGSLSGSACLLLPHSLWRCYLTGTGDNRFQEANSQQVRHPWSPAGAATTRRAWSAGFSSAARRGEAWNLIFSPLRPVLFLLSLATSCKKHGLLLGQMRKLRPREGKKFPWTALCSEPVSCSGFLDSTVDLSSPGGLSQRPWKGEVAEGGIPVSSEYQPKI